MFVHKLVLSSDPELSPEDSSNSIDYLKTRPGFLGVIAVNNGTGYTLWETEENATTFVPYDGLVNDLIVSTEVMSLEASGKAQEDFNSL